MTKKKRTDTILAEGEATGHYHELNGPVVVFGDSDERTFVADDKVTLKHQEHGQQIIDPEHYGTKEFESGIVNEFDPFADSIRKVVD